MIIVKAQKEVGGYDSQGNRYIWAHLECDSAADLPAPDYFKADAAAILAMGSTAHDISQNASYKMQSDGTWVLQQPGTAAYTKAEVDTMLQARDALQAEDRAAIVGLVDGGAKNLLKNTAPYGELVKSNITFTHYSNDAYLVNAENPSTANTDLYVAANISLDPGNYILTGCPAGGDNTSTYKLQIAGIGYDLGNGFSFTITQATTTSVYIRIWAGYVPNGLVFKPMICRAADNAISSAFVPYAPTNRELYEMILALQ